MAAIIPTTIRALIGLAGLSASLFAAPGDFGAQFTDCPNAGHCRFTRWDAVGSSAWDYVGRRIEVHGDVAAVGAQGDDKVFMYVRIDGEWQNTDVVVPPAGATAIGFAGSLAVTDDYLFVGARWDFLAAPSGGAVYYYQRVGNNWIYEGVLTAAVPEIGAAFGQTLATNGNILAVGAPDTAVGGTIHMFDLTGPFVEYETIEEPGSDRLGGSMHMDENYLVVGDYSDGTMGFWAGAVYLYEVWIGGHSPGWKTVAFDGAGGDTFGRRVSIHDDYVVVGSHGDDDNGSASGSAYVYEVHPIGPGLGFVQKLHGCNMTDDSLFGHDVAVWGRFMLIGAPGKGPAGEVHVYRKSGNSIPPWNGYTVLEPYDVLPGSDFGRTVELEGLYPFVGAPFANGFSPTSGAVFPFSLGSDDLVAGTACPCDTYATDEHYGSGKAGLPGVPRLSGWRPPLIGQSTEMQLTNARPGATPILVWGPGADARPFDLGTLHVASPSLIVLPPVPAGGEDYISYNMPMDPTLCGMTHAFQVLILDPAAVGPFQTAQTNGLLRTYGW